MPFSVFIMQECLKRQYGLQASEVRAFVHYQPSYYHFHVHFTHAQMEMPGLMAGKAHLLQSVLHNLENIDPNYYAKCMLSFHLTESDPLFARFMQCKRGFVHH